MGKLKPLPQNKVIKILNKNGFKKIRKGKHITFKKIKKDGRILTTWIPYHKEISLFVIKYIIKQTEKSPTEFV